MTERTSPNAGGVTVASGPSMLGGTDDNPAPKRQRRASRVGEQQQPPKASNGLYPDVRQGALGSQVSRAEELARWEAAHARSSDQAEAPPSRLELVTRATRLIAAEAKARKADVKARAAAATARLASLDAQIAAAEAELAAAVACHAAGTARRATRDCFALLPRALWPPSLLPPAAAAPPPPAPAAAATDKNPVGGGAGSA